MAALVLLLLLWLTIAIGAGAIASSKDRSFFGYLLLGLLFPLVGLIIAIGIAPRLADEREPSMSFGELLPWIVLGAAGVVVMLSLTSKA